MSDRQRLQPRIDGARARGAGAPPERYPGYAKTEFGGFLEAGLGVADRTHIARESDFAEDHRVVGNRRFSQRRDEGGGDGEVGRRFDDPQPARYIEIDVVDADRQATPGVENGGDHSQPGSVPSD